MFIKKISLIGIFHFNVKQRLLTTTGFSPGLTEAAPRPPDVDAGTQLDCGCSQADGIFEQPVNPGGL